MKQYVGISRDHSASMGSIVKGAMADYNNTIAALKEAGSIHGIETLVSVVNCGDGYNATVSRDTVNKDILRISPITNYTARANGTPLWDSVGELISILSKVPDANDPDVSFIVMVITDGEENRSQIWNATTLGSKIRELQNTDRWTFVFRVPKGYGKTLTRLGIPVGNIQEWEQTEAGFAVATVQTTQGFSEYYKARSTGVRSTSSFFVNLGEAPKKVITENLNRVNAQYECQHVQRHEDGMQIRDYVTKYRGSYYPGCAFYQLIKSEIVQPTKEFLVLDNKTGRLYGGSEARDILGLPNNGSVHLRPGNLGDFTLFVQSMSNNRKVAYRTMLYYRK